MATITTKNPLISQYKKGINEYLILRGYIKNTDKHPILLNYSQILDLDETILLIGSNFSKFNKWFNDNNLNLNQDIFDMREQYFYLTRLRGKYESYCVKQGLPKCEARGRFNKRYGRDTIDDIRAKVQELFGYDFFRAKSERKIDESIYQEEPNCEEHWNFD